MGLKILKSYKSLLLGVLVLMVSRPVTWVDAKATSPSPQDPGLLKTVVEVGPFLINSFYLSGEGPGRIRYISVEELVAHKTTTWIEATEGMSQELVALNSENKSFLEANPPGKKIPVLHQEIEQQHIDPSTTPDVLYWVRGATLEILDENNRVLDHPEFLCHSLIFVDSFRHAQYFSQSSQRDLGLLFNFSQGITHILFPENAAIPLSSHDRLQFDFKSLNRTADTPRHIKCRWTLYLVPDKALVRPMKPMHLFHSGINVVVSGKDDPNRFLPKGCGGAARCDLKHKGKDAPNDMLHRKLNTPFEKNEKGEEITWHWVIPPGRHRYRTLHPEHNFDLDGPLLAAGAHVHPYCEKISLIETRPGQPDKEVFTLYSKTNTTPGLRIEHIDYLTWPLNGFPLDKKAVYGLEVTYNNTSAVDQDSMAFMTLYYENLHFKKPDWALKS